MGADGPIPRVSEAVGTWEPAEFMGEERAMTPFISVVRFRDILDECWLTVRLFTHLVSGPLEERAGS